MVRRNDIAQYAEMLAHHVERLHVSDAIVERGGALDICVEPNETRTFEINLEPGFFVFHYGPELVVTTSSDIRVERIDITHRDGRPSDQRWPGSDHRNRVQHP